jgi:uncharacterized protein
MPLETTGEIIVQVDRETAFKFVEVPEQLAQCIPGCSDLREVAPGRFTATLTSEVSFMTLKFQVVVEVVKINPPNDIEARITGRPTGISGNLAATAALHLTDAGPGRTLIRHSSSVGLTGKLGSLGQPVFRAKSAEMSGKFAANLKAAIETNAAGTQVAGQSRA